MFECKMIRTFKCLNKQILPSLLQMPKKKAMQNNDNSAFIINNNSSALERKVVFGTK